MSERHHDDDAVRLYCGDCLDILPTLAANLFTACVCDPPYEIGFMGRAWDSTGVAFRPETWAAVLRALKPGAMLLAFGGTRTFHRMACAIEDGGFELRDTIMWVYGSGFPKSRDVSKAIDKAAGAERVKVSGGTGPGWQRNIGNTRPWMKEQDHTIDGPEPITPLAAKFRGYGTALKPAWEPIIVAMKPTDGTFARNAERHGVAGINVDGCRIGTAKNVPASVSRHGQWYGTGEEVGSEGGHDATLGRWPANLIHDGSDEVVAGFPETASPGHTPRSRGVGGIACDGHRGQDSIDKVWYDSGSAARFFYCAKASKSERGDGNNHPTVKPLALMRYLCRLVTPPDGGLILDPFLGSGTTAIAAIAEGNAFAGIELNQHNLAIATARIKRELAQRRLPGMDATTIAEGTQFLPGFET